MSCTQSYSSYCVLNLSLFCGIAGNVLWSSYRPIRKRSILRKCKSLTTPGVDLHQRNTLNWMTRYPLWNLILILTPSKNHIRRNRIVERLCKNFVVFCSTFIIYLQIFAKNHSPPHWRWRKRPRSAESHPRRLETLLLALCERSVIWRVNPFPEAKGVLVECGGFEREKENKIKREIRTI